MQGNLEDIFDQIQPKTREEVAVTGPVLRPFQKNMNNQLRGS